jgi:catechol 2,3-dioxygenase-like lactoylglutathione lyase family enzyme
VDDGPRISPTSMRIARPVREIAASVHFYVDLVGLQHLGGFDGHDGYSGAFVGVQGADWHVEFTSGPNGSPTPTPTDEDLLVLYLPAEQVGTTATRLRAAGSTAVGHENPYWAAVGAIVFRDPDRYLLVLCPVGG